MMWDEIKKIIFRDVMGFSLHTWVLITGQGRLLSWFLSCQADSDRQVVITSYTRDKEK